MSYVISFFNFKVDPFVDGDLVIVKGLVYFDEPQGYVAGSLMLPMGPPFLNRSVVRGRQRVI